MDTDRLRALAVDFANTYRLDKFQRDKLVEMMESIPSLSRMVCPSCMTDQPLRVFDRDSGLCAVCEEERRRGR